MKNDPTIVKLVHQEVYKTFAIHATISRFGNLFVVVNDSAGNFVWHGNNLLDARAAADKVILDNRADEAHYYAQFG